MTKEELAEQYAEEQNSAYTNDYYGFLAGYEAGQPKWIDIEDGLPKEDVQVLCKIFNEDIPEILNYQVCRYYEGNWYGDLNIDDKVIQWVEIPK